MEDPRASSQNQPADLHRAVHLHWDLISLHKQCANRLLCAHNIHTGQQSLLFMLKHMGACNQKELARALHISPATIAISLKRLERSGLVRRVPDQQDLRSNRIELTQAGVESADFAEKVIDQITERSFKDFSAAEFELLICLLSRMASNLRVFRDYLQKKEESPCDK